jgi:serine/threonine protein kinase/ankyrin repeat protein/GTPase SAR1 family protein
MASINQSYVRKLAEGLGTVLSAEPSESQKQVFDQYMEMALNQHCLEKVINFPIQRYSGRTLVHIAADKGLHECLEELLKNGGNPNKTSSPPDLDQTPMHLACLQGYARCIQILVKYGAHIRVKNAHRATPIDLVKGKVNCEKVLLHAIAQVELPERSTDQLQRVRELHQLLDQSVVDIKRFTEIYESLSSIEKDLSSRWTDWFQKTLLFQAVDKNQLEIVDLQLRNSASIPLPNYGNGDTPLLAACRNGNIEIVDCLCRYAPTLVFMFDNEEMHSPLHLSCHRGDRGIVKILLETIETLYISKETQQDINMADANGRTPLYNACYGGHVEIVRDLLLFKTSFPDKLDVNFSDASKRTPLHAAVASITNSLEISQLLLSEPDLEINPEGFPSSRTDKYLCKLLERKKFSTMQQKSSSSLLSSNSTSDQSPPETPISDIFDVVSGDNTVGTEDNTATTDSSSPATTNVRISFLQSMTSITLPRSPPSLDLVNKLSVYCSPSGLLEVSETAIDWTPFKKMLMTPLAEACVFRNKDIVETLLNHGAVDVNGLACQLSHIVGRSSLTRLILSKQCFLNEDAQEIGVPMPTPYTLKWNEKHLQEIDGKYLSQFQLYSIPGPTNNPLFSPSIQVELVNIHTVYLQKNHLKTIPVELFMLSNVHVIDLSNNQITVLPEKFGSDFWQCHSLTVLKLSNNQLHTLPPSLWILSSLERLIANKNSISSLISQQDLIKEFQICPSLKEINLSHNKLAGLQDFLFDLPQIQKLDLSHNEIITLPHSLWQSESLQRLNLSHNHLQYLPLCEDDEVHMSSIAIKSCAPANLFEIANPMNNPRAVFTEITPFSRYKYNNSERRKLPKSRSHTSMSEFDVCLPMQDFIEQEEDPTIEACDYSTMTHLNISHNYLQKVPEGLPCLAPNLNDLDISNNKITKIDIVHLPQSLRKLTAINCGIVRIGNTLTNKQLKATRMKCFYDSQATHCLHRSHTCLQYMQTLKLSGNQLKKFQLMKCSLKRVTEDPTLQEDVFLTKEFNSLKLLYPSLEGLDLAKNCLEGRFNPNIGRQTQLQWIIFNNNTMLGEIPLEIALLKNTRRLTLVELRDLPELKVPPKEYQNQQVQTSQLLTYMRSRLKKSVDYRTMKLFFIGCGQRGKTTLLKRLRDQQSGEPDRTEGIDIEEWSCSGGKKKLFQSSRQPIHFLAWDFAGQDVYQVTHQCFYSRRALYLAMFRLTDGDEGVNELESWLRNIQLRAPGCIVLIVGTYLDKVTEAEANRLEKLVIEKYSNKTKLYPKIVACVNVSCVRHYKSNIDKLKQCIYHIVTHLRIKPDDGVTLDYKKEIEPNDPYALLQQQIPESFLTLQHNVSELVTKFHGLQRAPVLNYNEFKENFLEYFDDEEEMNEAVNYLTLQGTLLHFNDYGLKELYFLDPQWLAKLMAKLINPSSADNIKLTNGQILISDLYKNELFLAENRTMSDKYLQLLQKFEVALCISDKEVIIPSLLPDEPAFGSFPKPNDFLTDVTLSFSQVDAYQPPIRRIWFANYISDGFFPRLICRVINDQQIKSVMNHFYENTDGYTQLNWICWRKGIVFKSRGYTLMIIRVVDNPNTEWSPEITAVKCKYRIEVHIYVPEMINVVQELIDLEKCDFEDVPTPYVVAGFATRLIVAISNHISFLSSWFQGMLADHTDSLGYVPCWKCYGGILLLPTDDVDNCQSESAVFVDYDNQPVFCLSFNECIIPACKNNNIHCINHGALKIVQSIPDLAFWDLVTKSEEMESRPLRILENEVLGKGGYGFVCKGELKSSSCQNEIVAVKIFLTNVDIEKYSSSELVGLAKHDNQIEHAYKEIRQEVSFLLTLKHEHITRLVGVRTKPVFCMLLELAPKKSLRSLLKDYQQLKCVLEPLTLKQCAKQIADGLNYLHRHQIVHLDMKSPNVLVWEFPYFTSRRDRVRHAGNVKLKIADYGISQVSTSLMMRVTTSPVGTPGYMAPELFNSTGQEIYSTKVDVFAYGMTLYELISLQPPFSKNDAQKRNHEVRSGKRPPIGSKERHSPLLVQELMKLCWHNDPVVRPSMRQCHEWTSSVEFERLRAQITLGNCSAISCSCVSRIEPEYENEWVKFSKKHSALAELPTVINGVTINKQEIQQFNCDVEMIPPETESIEIEESLVKLKNDDADTIQSIDENDDDVTVDTGLDNGAVSSPKVSFRKSPSKNISSSSLNETKELTATLLKDAYTQIWMCGRDQKKGLLSVFIFPDNQRNISRFFGYVGKEEIQSLCPVRNAIWIGTALGNLRIVHSPFLSVKYSGNLFSSPDQQAAILKILHVNEENCVLISLTSCEVFSVHDRLIGEPPSLAKEQVILTTDREAGGPVYDMVKAEVNGQLQVWGTMDNNTLLLLVKNGQGEWTSSYHDVYPYSHHMKVCSHIVLCSFMEEGTKLDHLWISYRSKGGLVCFDPQAKQQRRTINCTEMLRSKKDPDMTNQVTSLLAHGRRLYVGTLTGTVAVFDSLTCGLVTWFSWHQGKVRTLMLLPEEVKTCVCGEIPINEGRRESQHALVSENSNHSTDNDHMEASLLASIGNGRTKLLTNQSPPRRMTRTNNEDITLLLWNS